MKKPPRDACRLMRHRFRGRWVRSYQRRFVHHMRQPRCGWTWGSASGTRVASHDDGRQRRRDTRGAARDRARYRERRGRELRELAATAVEGEVLAAGEFSSVPKEAMAAIPFAGVLMIPWARLRARRSGLPQNLLIALDADEVHLLELDKPGIGSDELAASPFRRWHRSRYGSRRCGARSGTISRSTSRTPTSPDPLRATLRTNPWSSEVVRLLGGEAPEPLDLAA